MIKMNLGSNENYYCIDKPTLSVSEMPLAIINSRKDLLYYLIKKSQSHGVIHSSLLFITV
jgi:hypothetical protein